MLSSDAGSETSSGQIRSSSILYIFYFRNGSATRCTLLSRLDELLLEVLNLFQYCPPARSTLGIPPLDRSLEIENVLDVLAEMRRDGLELFESEVREWYALFFGDTDARTRDVVSLSEGNL